MNKVILMGRLTTAPELKQTQSGTAVTRFSIAVRRRFAKEGQQDTDFINCTAWSKTAEFICKYFAKGAMIAVSGEIQTSTWEDESGKKQYRTEVVASEAYFTGEKKESPSNEPSAPSFDDFGGFSEPVPWEG